MTFRDGVDRNFRLQTWCSQLPRVQSLDDFGCSAKKCLRPIPLPVRCYHVGTAFVEPVRLVKQESFFSHFFFSRSRYRLSDNFFRLQRSFGGNKCYFQRPSEPSCVHLRFRWDAPFKYTCVPVIPGDERKWNTGCRCLDVGGRDKEQILKTTVKSRTNQS